MTSIGLDQTRRRIEIERRLDMVTERSLQHSYRPRDDAVQVEDLGGHALVPAQRKQMAGQPRRRQRGATDFVGVLQAFIAAVERRDEQLGVSGNRRQEVVEIVGDAAGKTANRFHFLRLHFALIGPPEVLESRLCLIAFATSRRRFTQRIRARAFGLDPPPVLAQETGESENGYRDTRHVQNHTAQLASVMPAAIPQLA